MHVILGFNGRYTDWLRLVTAAEPLTTWVTLSEGKPYTVTLGGEREDFHSHPETMSFLTLLVRLGRLAMMEHKVERMSDYCPVFIHQGGADVLRWDESLMTHWRNRFSETDRSNAFRFIVLAGLCRSTEKDDSMGLEWNLSRIREPFVQMLDKWMTGRHHNLLEAYVRDRRVLDQQWLECYLDSERRAKE